MDAWERLHPGDPGITFDTQGNALIKGMPYEPTRLDRLLYQCRMFHPEEMCIVGREPINGVTANVVGRRGTVYYKQASMACDVFVYIVVGFRHIQATTMALWHDLSNDEQ